MRFTRRIASVLAVAVAAVALPFSATAAPQILALLSTNGATPLVCGDGVCSGQFSGFCLQRERPNPSPGAAYRVEAGELTLVVTGADGAETRLPAADYASITTERSYTSVRVSVPESLRRQWGAVSIALEIGEMVTLSPSASRGDPDPQAEADIALAVGPQRALGEKIIDRAGAEADAVRVTNMLINALPPHGRTSESVRTGLWDRVAAPRRAAFPRAGMNSARAVYESCLARVKQGRFFNLRQCLEVGHDSIMLDLNLKYWEAGPEG